MRRVLEAGRVGARLAYARNLCQPKSRKRPSPYGGTGIQTIAHDEEATPVAALRNHVKRFVTRTGIKTNLEGSVRLGRLNPPPGTVLCRVAQESFPNVDNHAPATRVTIRLWQLAEEVRMEIVENGRAFSVSNPANGSDRQPLDCSARRNTSGS